MDFTTIIVIGAIVLLVAYLINRNQAKPNNYTNNNPQQGTERPSHDDPNIQGHGSLGRDRGTSTPMNNQMNSSTGDATKPNVITHDGNDDPNVSGQGGFGRNK